MQSHVHTHLWLHYVTNFRALCRPRKLLCLLVLLTPTGQPIRGNRVIILDFGRDDDSGKQKSPPHSLSLPFRLVMAQIIEIRGFEFSSFRVLDARWVLNANWTGFAPSFLIYSMTFPSFGIEKSLNRTIIWEGGTLDLRFVFNLLLIRVGYGYPKIRFFGHRTNHF